jgi:hypothetical protein
MIWLALALLLSFASVASLAALDRRRWKAWPGTLVAGRSGNVSVGIALAAAAAWASAAIPSLDPWVGAIAFGSQFTLAALAYGLLAGIDAHRAHRLVAPCLVIAIALLAWLLVSAP